jgi:hypothetical protein
MHSRPTRPSQSEGTGHRSVDTKGAAPSGTLAARDRGPYVAHVARLEVPAERTWREGLLDGKVDPALLNVQ